MKCYINYHTGAGNEWIEGTPDDAMSAADKNAAYTQQPITIEDEQGNELWRRSWWGVKFDPNADDSDIDDIIDFNDCGYYGAWQ